jgi:hypothetical protein
MSDTNEDGTSTGPQEQAATAAAPLPVPPPAQPPVASPPVASPPVASPPPSPGYAYPPAVPQGYGPGALGRTRGTGICMLLAVVTLGIYPLVWFFKVHDELKRHRGTGLGGGLALVLAIFVGIVMPYLTASEIGEAFEARGQAKPVSGLTGLWYFPGSFLIVGPIVWFVKTNGALNSYWRSLGAH